MRMIILIFFVVGSLLSCKTNKLLTRISYPLNDKANLHLSIPKGYDFFHTKGGAEFDTYLYIYSDSSCVYITDGSASGENYNNIKEEKKMDTLLYAQLENDTLILSGIDKKKLYWKNCFYRSYTIGYKNVTKEKKDIFDKSIDSFKIR